MRMLLKNQTYLVLMFLFMVAMACSSVMISQHSDNHLNILMDLDGLSE